MNWLHLIERRQSVRNFQSQVGEADIALAKKLCQAPERYNDSPLRLVVVEGGRISTCLKGLARVKAPWYIAALAGSDGDLFNLGYTVEKVVLQLTGAGLATCWLGAISNRQALTQAIGICSGEQVQALVAWGKPGRPGWNRVFKSVAGLHKRLPPERISRFPSRGEQDLSFWRPVLEAVRWAPSAVNRQPWRLKFEQKAVHLFSASGRIPITRKYLPIDMGIALCHLVLACRQLGYVGEVQQVEQDEPGWQYWCSYVLTKSRGS